MKPLPPVPSLPSADGSRFVFNRLSLVRYRAMGLFAALVVMLGVALITFGIWQGQSEKRLRDGLAQQGLAVTAITHTRIDGWSGVRANKLDLQQSSIALKNIVFLDSTLTAESVVIDLTMLASVPSVIDTLRSFFAVLRTGDAIDTTLIVPTPFGTLSFRGMGMIDPHRETWTLRDDQGRDAVVCTIARSTLSSGHLGCDLSDLHITAGALTLKRGSGWISIDQRADDNSTITADIRAGSGAITFGALTIPLETIWIATQNGAQEWTGSAQMGGGVLMTDQAEAFFSFSATPDTRNGPAWILTAEGQSIPLPLFTLTRFLPSIQMNGAVDLALRALIQPDNQWTLLPESTLVGRDTLRVVYQPDHYPDALSGDRTDIVQTRQILSDYTIDRLRVAASGPLPGILNIRIQSLGTNTAAFGDQPIQLDVTVSFNPFQ